jgi:hypothetical protein
MPWFLINCDVYIWQYKKCILQKFFKIGSKNKCRLRITKSAEIRNFHLLSILIYSY